jgi:hypothetical protein
MAKSIKLGARTPGQLIVWANISDRHEKYVLAEEKLREAIATAPRLAAPALALGEFLLAHVISESPTTCLPGYRKRCSTAWTQRTAARFGHCSATSTPVATEGSGRPL